MSAHSPGERFGPYELVSILGVGGMGEVWKARDTRVDRPVALKFAQSGFTERFERESRAIAALNHPNICHLYDVGPDYLVMEYVEGEPVRPPGNWRTLLDFAIDIAAGLADAHAAGIIHRDLKPDNILVRPDGVVKILDFGLAKRAVEGILDTRTMPVTSVGSIVGTVAYMSPEQATGRDLDARSDQFSFGLILYELACGKRPFVRPSSAETMTAIIREEPEPLPADVPTPVAWIIERCLAKDPMHRYDSTRDLFRELSTIRQHLSEVTRALPPMTRPSPSRGWLRAAALVLVGAACGAGALAWWRGPSALEELPWTGAQLGGASVSFNPRISPDGHLLAFVALVNGMMELAVMEPGSESWTFLTHGGRAGSVQNVDWSRDGSKLYFDRYTSQPVGVYTIPPLGGSEVLLLEKAFQPRALPDGSLLLLRVSGSSDQLFRFWPRDGKLQPLPAFLTMTDVAAPFCPFPDGRRVAYFGRPSADAAQPNALRVLDLDTDKVRTIDAAADIDSASLLSLPLAVTPDGAGVLTIARHGDTYEMIQANADGAAGLRVLMTFKFNELPWNIDAAPDGSLYLDQVARPASIAQVTIGRNGTEQLSAPRFENGPILALGDGRMVVASGGGKPRVLIGTPGGEFRRFLQIDEPTTGPLSRAGEDAVALMVGEKGRHRIALASVTDGHVLRELPIPEGEFGGLAVSPDRAAVYYVLNGSVFGLAGAGPARRLGQGDTVILDPSGRYLYATQFAYDPIRLVRIDTVSGAETAIPLPSEPRLAPNTLSPTAIDSSQRMLVPTTSPLMWFYRAAILDLRSGQMTDVPMSFVGDCISPGWTKDGSIVCGGVGLTGSLWRFQRGRSVGGK